MDVFCLWHFIIDPKGCHKCDDFPMMTVLQPTRPAHVIVPVNLKVPSLFTCMLQVTCKLISTTVSFKWLTRSISSVDIMQCHVAISIYPFSS